LVFAKVVDGCCFLKKVFFTSLNLHQQCK